MAVHRRWFLDNKLSTLTETFPFDKDNYPKQYYNLFRIGKPFIAPPEFNNTLVIANDCCYRLLRCSLEEGHNPVLNMDLTHKISREYFFHARGLSFLYNNFPEIGAFHPDVQWIEQHKEKYKQLTQQGLFNFIDKDDYLRNKVQKDLLLGGINL